MEEALELLVAEIESLGFPLRARRLPSPGMARAAESMGLRLGYGRV